MRIPSHRMLWLSAATLLLAIVACTWFVLPRSQTTCENFDRIHEGMSLDEAREMLGGAPGVLAGNPIAGKYVCRWESGPNWIIISFIDGKVLSKEVYIATTWKTTQWYGKKGAEKIGIKWQ